MMMKRMVYISSTTLLCVLAAVGAANVALGLTGSTEVAALAALTAFLGNFFMIVPVRSPIIK